MRISNPGDVKSIKPPITLEKGDLIVDADGVIVAYLKADDGGNDMAASDSKPTQSELESAQATIEDKLDDIIRNGLDLRVDSGQAYIHDTDEAIRYIQAIITTETNKARVDELENLPLSDYEDVTDGGDETWFEYISLEDRDKRIAALQKEQK